MSEQESRPTQSGGAAPEEFADSGPQITIAEQRTILLDDARKHRKHVRAAHEFAAQWLGKLLYVVGIGWHHWDGKRWAEDKGGTRAKAAAMETLKAMWGLALGDKDLASDVMACSTASGVRGVLELAGSLEGMCAAAADMDADPYLLNCANGTLDLHGLELRPHDPDDRITKVTRAAYVPGARSELWEDFLEQVLPDDHVRSYLARFFGVGLVGKVLEHVFPIATGTGRNGKGVAYTSVLHALGDYGGVADPALMEVVKSNPNAPSPAFFDLRGRRMVVLSETDTKIRLSASVLKRLTGGDPIKARALRKDPIEFLPSHSFLMVTNHLPELPSKVADPAVWSRVRAVPFNVVIPPDEQDPRLPEKLELAADAILTWMVAGLGEYWERGLDEPEAVQERTSEYAEGQDDVRRFVAEQCETGGIGDTTTVLHEAYKDWCTAEGIYRRDQLGRSAFADALARLDYPSVKERRGMVHQGLNVLREALTVSKEPMVELPPGQRPAAVPQQSPKPQTSVWDEVADAPGIMLL